MVRKPLWKRLGRVRGPAAERPPLRPKTGHRLRDLALLEDRILFSGGPAAVNADVLGDPLAIDGLPDLLSANLWDAAAFEQPRPADNGSSAVLTAGQPGHVEAPPAEPGQQPAVEHPLDSSQPVSSRELVFVDPATENYQQLLDDLLESAGNERVFEVILLAADQNGVEQISHTLARYEQLDAVHFVSHGSDGRIQLGNTTLENSNLAEYADAIADWDAAIRDGGDLLIYGCDLAATSAGQSLLSALGELTACDVAASTDETGAASLGGDWDFEFATGAIDTALAFSTELQRQYQGLLAINTLYADSDAYPEGSLKPGVPIQLPPPADYDGDDGEPGGLLKKTGEGFAESDNLEYLQWTIDGPVYLDGPATFTVYAAMKDWGTGETGTITAYLVDCASDGSDCQIISQGFDTNSVWTGIPNDFHQYTISFNPFTPYAIMPGRALGVKIINDDTAGSPSTDDMWIAYDTTLQPTQLVYNFTNSAVPTIGNLDGDSQLYVEGEGPLVIDDGLAATLSDPDTDPLDGGTLRVDIIAGNQASEDVLSIRDNGPLTFSGGSVRDGATVFGTATGGSGGNPLVISFNANATLARVEMLIQNLTYENTDTLDPDNARRDIRIDLDDGEGGFAASSEVSVTVADAILIVDTASDVSDAPDTSSIKALLLNKGLDGQISLREALEATNGSPNVGDLDEIHFNISGGPHSIDVGNIPDGDNGPMTDILDAVVIDGYTQPGASKNSLSLGSDANLMIELDGTNAGTGIAGLYLVGSGADGTEIRGLVINRFDGAGIEINGTDNVRIDGNYLGTNFAGAGGGIGNNESGVWVHSGSTGVTIGGLTPGERNVISGNAHHGVLLAGSSTMANFVRGNYIGLDAAGTTAVANGRQGIQIANSPGNTIGGAVAGAGNVISGNTWSGVSIQLANADSNVVQGNRIGTDAGGLAAIPNQNYGVDIFNGGPKDNLVGGSSPLARNLISGNMWSGVQISGNGADGNTISGNWIGTDINGTAGIPNQLGGVVVEGGADDNTIGGATVAHGNRIAFNNGDGVKLLGNGTDGNAIRRNQIHSNTGIGIDIRNDGVTPNDPGDGDSGPNDEQNYPTITKAEIAGGQIIISGTLNSTSGATFELDFFLGSGSGGQAETYLGSTTVTANTTSHGAFRVVLTATVSVGQFITATATETGLQTNTSEFSAAVAAFAETESLWLVTAGDVPPTSGADGLDEWTAGEILALGDPNLSLGGTTAGTFSFAASLDALGDGDVQIDAIHYVSTALTIAGTFPLQVGDLLLSTAADELLTNFDLSTFSASASDVFLFRPLTPGDYSRGSFQLLLQAGGAGGSDLPNSIRGVSLVESAVSVGSGGGQVDLAAGEFLLVTDGGAARWLDIWRFVPTSVGAGSTRGSLTELVDGSDLGINQPLAGIDIIEHDLDIGGITLDAGQILATMSGDDGFVGLTADRQDLFALRLTAAGSNTVATWGTVLDGSQVGLNTAQESLNGFTFLSPGAVPPNLAPVAGDDTYNVAEDGALVTVTGVLDNDSDPDTDPLSAVLDSGPGQAASFMLNSNGTFNYTPVANFTGVDTFTYFANDGTINSLAATVTITVTAVNDAPVLTPSGLGVVAGTDEDTISSGTAVAAIVGATITDPDAAAAAGIALTATSGNGTWEFSVDAGATWTTVGAVTPATAVLLRDIDLLRYRPDTIDGETATITYKAWDQTGATAGQQGLLADASTGGTTTPFSAIADTASLSVLPIPDPPTISGLNGDVLNYAAGGAPQPIDAGGDAVVGDVDSLNFAAGNLTVSITAGLVPAEDILGIRNQGTAVGQIGVAGGNVTYNFGSGVVVIGTMAGGSAGSPLVVTFNANATPIAATALVRNVTYHNADATNPTGAARTIGFSLVDGDGGASVPVNATVNVASLNDPPVNNLPASQNTLYETPLTFSAASFNPISISDIDAAGGVLRVRLGVASGRLALGTTAGVLISSGANNSSSVTIQGTLASINAALNGLRYTPNRGFSGTDTLWMTTSDQGNTGVDGAKTDVDSVTIRVAGNNAPAITAIANQLVSEDAWLGPLTFTVSDVETPVGGLSVSAVSSNQSIIPNSQIVIGGMGASRTISLQPALNQNGGPVAIAVAVSDGTATSVEVFTVLVRPQPDAPITANDAFVVTQDQLLNVPAPGVLANDFEPDGEPMAISVVAGPANGTLVALPNGAFRYLPDPEYFGTDYFLYVATDGTLVSKVARVQILVRPDIAALPPVLDPPADDPPDDADTQSDPDTDPDSPPADPDLPATADPGGSSLSLSGNPLGVPTESPVASPPPSLVTAASTVAAQLDVGVEPETIDREVLRSVDRSRTSPGRISDSTSIGAVDSYGGQFENLQFIVEGSGLWNEMDELEELVEHAGEVQQLAGGAVLGVSSGLTAGYVLWLVRGGYLLSSLLAQMPAWKFIDPLPVLEFLDKNNKVDDEHGDSLAGILAQSDDTKTEHQSESRNS